MLLNGLSLAGSYFGVNEEGMVGAAVSCRELHGDSSLPSRSGVVRGAGDAWGRRDWAAAP